MKITSLVRCSRRFLMGAAIAVVLDAESLQKSNAASGTWDPGHTPAAPSGGSGAWEANAAANWSNGATDGPWTDQSATAPADKAVFGGTAGTVTLSGLLSVLTLELNTPGYVFGGAGTLSIGCGGAGGITEGAGVSGGVTVFQSDLTVNLLNSHANGNLTLTLQPGSTLQIDGLVQNGPSAGGNGNIVLDGGGNLVLNHANTFSGTFIIGKGTLTLGHGDALGKAVLGMNHSRVHLVGGGTYPNAITGSGGAVLKSVSGDNTVAGTFTVISSGGFATLEAEAESTLTMANTVTTSFTTPRTLAVTGAGHVRVTGNILDKPQAPEVTLGLAKSGKGTLTLSGSGNSFTGPTTVTGGKLVVNSVTGSGGTFAVSPGAALGGSGVVGGAVKTAAQGAILDATTRLTVASADLSAGGTIRSAPGIPLVVTGTLAAAPAVTPENKILFTFNGGTKDTPYTLLTYGNAPGLTPAHFALSPASTAAGYALDTSFGTEGWKTEGNNVIVKFAQTPAL